MQQCDTSPRHAVSDSKNPNYGSGSSSNSLDSTTSESESDFHVIYVDFERESSQRIGVTMCNSDQVSAEQWSYSESHSYEVVRKVASTPVEIADSLENHDCDSTTLSPSLCHTPSSPLLPTSLSPNTSVAVLRETMQDLGATVVLLWPKAATWCADLTLLTSFSLIRSLTLIIAFSFYYVSVGFST